MKFEIEKGINKQAKRAHELFMIAVGGQLLIGPVGIFLEIGQLGIILPLLYSLLFYIYTQFQSRDTSHWFVSQHWQLALRRFHKLYIAYAITIVFLMLSWYIGTTIDPHSPQKFLPIALSRIGVMPTIIMLFVSLVLGNTGLNMAINSELPDKMVKNSPPPDAIKIIEES